MRSSPSICNQLIAIARSSPRKSCTDLFTARVEELCGVFGMQRVEAGQADLLIRGRVTALQQQRVSFWNRVLRTLNITFSFTPVSFVIVGQVQTPVDNGVFYVCRDRGRYVPRLYSQKKEMRRIVDGQAAKLAGIVGHCDRRAADKQLRNPFWPHLGIPVVVGIISAFAAFLTHKAWLPIVDPEARPEHYHAIAAVLAAPVACISACFAMALLSNSFYTNPRAAFLYKWFGASSPDGLRAIFAVGPVAVIGLMLLGWLILRNG